MSAPAPLTATAPLLSADDEVSLAQQLQRARTDLAWASAASGALLPWALHLEEQLEAGSVTAASVAWGDGASARRRDLLQRLDRLLKMLTARRASLDELRDYVLDLKLRTAVMYRLADAITDIEASAETAFTQLGPYSRATTNHELSLEVSTEQLRLAQATALTARRRAEHVVKRMLEANQGLAFHFAHKYLGRGVDRDDLVQEGLSGILQAIERFDPVRGTRFATYAAWWVRQGINRLLERDSQVVRVPSHFHGRLQALARTQRALRGELQREPRAEELMETLELSRAQLRELLTAQQRRFSSLDHALGDDEGPSPKDFIADLAAENPELRAQEKERAGQLHDALEELDERARYVVECRFGMRRAGIQTLAQVAEVLGISRERVRQIERDALATLRRRL